MGIQERGPTFLSAAQAILPIFTVKIVGNWTISGWYNQLEKHRLPEFVPNPSPGLPGNL
jgi:hypothetical protein